MWTGLLAEWMSSSRFIGGHIVLKYVSSIRKYICLYKGYENSFVKITRNTDFYLY